MNAENPVEGTSPELARALHDLQLILDALPAYIFYKDAHNRILRVNEAVASSLGVTPEDMVGTPTERWYPDEAAQYFADDLEVIRSGKPKRGIVEPIHTAEGQRWLQTEKFPQFSAQGQVVGIVVVAQDITERIRLEQEVSRALRLDSIGRLAGGVAHDFNNLLTAIVGHVEAILEETPTSSVANESLHAIQLAVQRCADLTGQLLALARKQPHAPSVVDLNTLVTDARRILARLIEENIEFSLALCRDPVMSLVDAGQISQVLINLAINARDAMPSGGSLTISSGSVLLDGTEPVQLSAGRYAFIDVEDTGKGMNEHERQHLFEPFFTTKEVGSGTGLGLATSYGIVRKNGGAIEVQTREGTGTRFRILLPLADSLPANAQASATPPISARSSATLLFVEDDQGLCELGVRVLTAAGYKVISAANGVDALELALGAAAQITLLISDVVMPKMGGFELAERLRLRSPNVRTLFLSGYADVAQLRGSALPLGRLLAKPFTRKQLLDCVHTVLTEVAQD